MGSETVFFEGKGFSGLAVETGEMSTKTPHCKVHCWVIWYVCSLPGEGWNYAPRGDGDESRLGVNDAWSASRIIVHFLSIAHHFVCHLLPLYCQDTLSLLSYLPGMGVWYPYLSWLGVWTSDLNPLTCLPCLPMRLSLSLKESLCQKDVTISHFASNAHPFFPNLDCLNKI